MPLVRGPKNGQGSGPVPQVAAPAPPLNELPSAEAGRYYTGRRGHNAQLTVRRFALPEAESGFRRNGKDRLGLSIRQLARWLGVPADETPESPEPSET